MLKFILEGKTNSQDSSIPNESLVICGAAYGRADVTEKIQCLQKDQKLSVKASNDVFGDSWTGVRKSLVIVYKYGSNRAQLQVAEEGKSITITPPSTAVGNEAKHGQSKLKINILGAAYGLSDVTSVAQSFVGVNQEFNKVASNAIWGDGWPGKRKTLVVVYECNKNFMLDIAVEGEQMRFNTSTPPPITILGAAYGLKPVTEEVKGLVKNRSVKATADNDTFEDGWPGVQKTLVIVYQYGREHPSITIVKEDRKFEFTYSKGNPFHGSTDSNTLTILGAAYGPSDVTSKVQSLVKHDGSLDVEASNGVFGDPWPGKVKSLVIVYRYGSNAPRIQTAAEHKKISVSIREPQSNSYYTKTRIPAQIDDRIRPTMDPPTPVETKTAPTSSPSDAVMLVRQDETVAITEVTKAELRSRVIKQIRDLFDLKELGAITEEEYEEKKKILLKDIK